MITLGRRAEPPSPNRKSTRAERDRFRLDRLVESAKARAVIGTALIAAAAAAVWAIVTAFTGGFTNVATVTAELPASSNAVPVDTPVEYRNITVGKVASMTHVANGGIGARLKIYPRYLGVIPADVEAEVQPLSIFGNQYVALVPPAKVTNAGHLAAHDVVTAYGGASSSSLQGTVTQLYDLLEAVHPAQLDTSLTALAQALNGQGQTLGHALSGAATYTGEALVPNLSNLQSDLQKFPVAVNTVNASAPQILGILSNSSITADTIRREALELNALLVKGSKASGQAAQVLARVQTSLPALLNESAPLLADVDRNPKELSQTLSGLTTFASAVAGSESHGPYLSLNMTIPIANINDAVNATLGYDNPASIDKGLGSAVNPPTYTSADCPEYPGESNPYCSGGSPDANPAGGSVSASAVAAGTLRPTDPSTGSATIGTGASSNASTRRASSTTSSGAPGGKGTTTTTSDPAITMASDSTSDPYAAELASARDVASALNGGQPAASPGFADLVLVPILGGVARP